MIHAVKLFDLCSIEFADVADHPDDDAFLAFRDVRPAPALLDPRKEVRELRTRRARLHDDDHGCEASIGPGVGRDDPTEVDVLYAG